MLTGAEYIDRNLLASITINEYAQSTYEPKWGQTDPTPPPPGDTQNPDDEDGEAEAS